MQPLCFSNGLTHSGARYPSHAIRFSRPSPLPMLLATGKFAVGTVSPDVPGEEFPPPPPPPPPAPLLLELPPQAATIAATPISARPPISRALARLDFFSSLNISWPTLSARVWLALRVLLLRDDDGLIRQPGDPGRRAGEFVGGAGFGRLLV